VRGIREKRESEKGASGRQVQKAKEMNNQAISIFLGADPQ
jgi:hypothetical protein